MRGPYLFLFILMQIHEMRTIISFSVLNEMIGFLNVMAVNIVCTIETQFHLELSYCHLKLSY